MDVKVIQNKIRLFAFLRLPILVCYYINDYEKMQIGFLYVDFFQYLETKVFIYAIVKFIIALWFKSVVAVVIGWLCDFVWHRGQH